MSYDLKTLMDPVPFLGGGVVTVPEPWRLAAATGWRLVSVLVMGNGTRVGYFQRDLVAIPDRKPPGDLSQGGKATKLRR